MIQYFVGGLGNQLFQYAMLHYVIENSNTQKGSAWIDKNPREDRPFLLKDVMSNCKHISYVGLPYAGLSGNLARLTQKISSIPFFGSFKLEEFREEKEFSFITDFEGIREKRILWIGYFQNFQYVEEVWDKIRPELFEKLHRTDLNINLPESYTLVHIRGGDFHQHLDHFGMLTEQYYSSSLETVEPLSQRFRIVVTDDVERAEKLKSIGADLILGPDDLDEWQTLKLMSGAEVVLTANSTFSWWGGRLALECGGRVLIPSPWFKNPKISVGSAFEHPNFEPSPSSFE